MSKLVDKERLARLAKALDARMKAAVAAEQQRAEGIEGGLRTDVNKKVEQTVYEAKVQELEQAIQDLETAMGSAEDGESLADVIKALEDKHDLFVTEQDVRDDAQDEAIAAKVAQADYNLKVQALENADTANANAISAEAGRAAGEEARIEGLVTAEAAKAREEEGKLDQAIKDEANTARAAEEANADAITAEVNRADAEEKRIVGLVEAEAERAAGKEGELAQAIANEASRADAAEKVNAQAILDEKAAREAADQALQTAINTEKSRAEGKEEELQTAIDKLNGGVDVVGSVDQKIADAISEVNSDAEALEERVKANEDKLAVVQGADTVEGSIAKAEKDAKDYADQAITALVNGAPEAMNTLNELAQAIANHQDVYEAYIEEVDGKIEAAEKAAKKHADDQDAVVSANFANADAALKQELQNEIDADVLVETNRAKGEEARIEAAAKAYADTQDNLVRADFAAADEDLHEIITGEVEDAIAAESALRQAEEADIRADFAAADAEVLADAKEYADGKNSAMNERVAALETFKNGHSHATMEQGIADNKAAIEQEVLDRDAAIAEALEEYSTSEEMKTLLGNVVNSLTLDMEDDEVVLKLGGVDGIAITSVSFNMATDADIDAIIAGLDAE